MVLSQDPVFLPSKIVPFRMSKAVITGAASPGDLLPSSIWMLKLIPSTPAPPVTEIGILQAVWPAGMSQSPTTMLNVAVSSSVTCSVSLPLVKPVADAVMVTVCVPSTIASSTAARSTVTDDWPAGIVAVVGTVASVVSLLDRSTVRANALSVLRVIVTVVAAAPAYSDTEADTTFTVNAAATFAAPGVTVVMDCQSPVPFG